MCRPPACSVCCRLAGDYCCLITGHTPERGWEFSAGAALGLTSSSRCSRSIQLLSQERKTSMTTTMSRSAAIAIAVIISFMAFFDARSMQAQYTVTNSTTCTVDLCLYDAAGAVFCTIGIPPTTGAAFAMLAGFTPIGVRSAALINHPFVAPPTPGCTGCITLPTATAPCCADVCLDAVALTITITPCGPPCKV